MVMALRSFTAKTTDNLGDWLGLVNKFRNKLTMAANIQEAGALLEEGEVLLRIHAPGADPPVLIAQQLMIALHDCLDQAVAIVDELVSDHEGVFHTPRIGRQFTAGLTHFSISYESNWSFGIYSAAHVFIITPHGTTDMSVHDPFNPGEDLDFGVRPPFWLASYDLIQGTDEYAGKWVVNCLAAPAGDPPVDFVTKSYLYRTS
jgi:hypothetical protein